MFEGCDGHDDQPSRRIVNACGIESSARGFGQALLWPVSERGQGHVNPILRIDHPPTLTVDARCGRLEFQSAPLASEVVIATPTMGIEQSGLEVCHDLVLFQVAFKHWLGDVDLGQSGLTFGQRSLRRANSSRSLRV